MNKILIALGMHLNQLGILICSHYDDWDPHPVVVGRI